MCLWQLLLAAPTFEALVRILPGRNQKYQCWMILAPQMETNCACFGHGPQALLLALRNAMKQGFSHVARFAAHRAVYASQSHRIFCVVPSTDGDIIRET